MSGEAKKCPSGPSQRFTLNLHLTKRRVQLGLTQQDVADRCKKTRTTVGRWEAGLEECGDYPGWAAALEVELVPVTYS